MKQKIINYLKEIDSKYNLNLRKYFRIIRYPLVSIKTKYNYFYGVYIMKNNSLKFQKEHWEKYSLNALNGGEKWSWGDPNDSNSYLGNYKLIQKYVIEKSKNKIVIDLGSLTGKWTQYMKEANKIWCVDLNTKGFQYIKENFDISNIEFYQTKGDELAIIENSSIDFCFSVDTLVRAPKEAIKNYFSEINRVLKDGGQAMIHLPCTCIETSLEMGFTKITLDEIIKYSKDNNLTLNVDFTTLNHGVICNLKKETKYD